MARSGLGGRPSGAPPKHTQAKEKIVDQIAEGLEGIEDDFDEDDIVIGAEDFTEDTAMNPLRAAIIKIDLLIDGGVAFSFRDKLLDIKDDIQRFIDGDEGGSGDIAETIRDVLVKNSRKINGWLTRIGNKDPLKALTLYKDLAEYIIPKIQRTGGGNNNEPQILLTFESAADHKKRTDKTGEQ